MKRFFTVLFSCSLLLCACSDENAETARMMFSENDAEAMSACKRVGKLSANDAEKFIPMLGEISGDRKCALIVSLGYAKAEGARESFLSILENSDDDYERLCALWSLEKLGKKADARALAALWDCALGGKPRSADYAFELLQIQEGIEVEKFLTAKLGGNFEDKKLATQLSALRGNPELFESCSAASKGNSELEDVFVENFGTAATPEDFSAYAAFALEMKNFDAKAKRALAGAAARLGKNAELLAILKTRDEKLCAEIRAMLPPSRKLIAMDTAMLDLSKREALSLDRVKLAARLGFSGMVPRLDALAAPAQSSEDPNFIDLSMGEGKELFTKMRHAGVRPNAVYVSAQIKDGKIAFPMDTSEILKYCRPMGADLWLSVRGSSNDIQPEALAKELEGVAKACAESGVSLALYPHENFYFPDAGSAAKFLDGFALKDIGIVYNLPHEYAALKKAGRSIEPEKMAADTLGLSARLRAVSVCGMDGTKSGAGNIITPLGGGDFDIKKFCDALFAAGFKGGVCLQGYNTWKLMPVEDALAQSMAAWRKWYE